jgi:hypothetical protein
VYAENIRDNPQCQLCWIPHAIEYLPVAADEPASVIPLLSVFFNSTR